MKRLLLAGMVLLAPTCAHAQSDGLEPDGRRLGACVWNALSSETRDEFIAAYVAAGAPIAGPTTVLERSDEQIKSKAAACAGRKDVPGLWAAGLTASVAIQAGAQAKLAPSGITEVQLLQAWRDAPPAARDCVKATAGKVFGIEPSTCSDKSAPRAFLSLVGISEPKDRVGDAVQVLLFMTALSQQLWAETLIAKLSAP